MIRILLLSDVNTINSQIVKLNEEANSIRRLKSEYEKKLVLIKKQIDNSFISEFSKLDKVESDIQLMDEKVKAESREKEKDIIEKNNDKVMNAINSAHRKYNDQEEEYRKTIEILEQNISDICNGNEKLIKKYSVTIINDNQYDQFNFDDINSLLVKIKDDTFNSFVKRLTKTEGYYNHNRMVKDYVEKASIAILSLKHLITDVLPSQQKKEIEQIKTQGMIDTQKDMKNLAEEFGYSEEGIKKSKEQCSNKKIKLTKQRDEEINNLTILKGQYADDCLNRAKELEKQTASVYSSELVTGFMERLKSKVKDTGYLDSDWQVDLNRNPSVFFSIGHVYAPCSVNNTGFKYELPNSISSVFNGEFFNLPLLIENNDYFCLFLQYTKKKELIHSAVQNIVLQKLRSNPVLSVDVVCTDPIDRGKNMSLLLGSTEENNKIGIQIINDNEAFERKLKELLEKIDNINSKIGTLDSVYSYNKENEKRISETLLVICDIDKALTENASKLLSTILVNAQRCGVSVIATSSYSLELIRSSFPERVRPNLGFLNFFNRNLIVNDESAHIDSKNKLKVCLDSIESDPLKQSFIERYRQKANNSSLDMDYSSYIVGNMSSKDSLEGINLPIFIENATGGGKIHNFALGTTANTHTLITGGTGSGKSSLLHTIISSIVSNYSPDDIELWLVDYGRVEFNQYINNRPPHVKLISTERTESFTFSFLDYLKDYFSKRESLFQQANVTNISEYRNKMGKESLPRIVLIIDEFHVMTQHCVHELRYRTILENALSEYRKFGLACIFSNQTISGLTGLTDSGLSQIRNRIAMFNKLQEMKDTLAVNYSNFDEDMIKKMERTEVGGLWYKEWTDNNDFSISYLKSIYLNQEDQKLIIEMAKRNSKDQNTSNVIIKDGNKRVYFPDFINEQEIRSNSISVYLGSPSSMKQYFRFELLPKYNNNIAILGHNDALLSDLILSIIRSISIADNKRIIILGRDSNLDILERYLSERLSSIEIYDRFEDICRIIHTLSRSISKRKKLEKDTVIVFLGITDIFDEFAVSQKIDDMLSQNIFEIKDINSVTNDYEVKKLTEELGVSIEDMLDYLAEPEEKSNESMIFDAREDTTNLFKLGSRFGLYSIVNLNYYNDIKQHCKQLQIDNFTHRIILQMSHQEIIDWGIRPDSVEYLTEENALYSSGIVNEYIKPFHFEV